MYLPKLFVTDVALTFLCSTDLRKRKLATVKGKKADVSSADKGLTLETSAFLPFTVANLRFQLSCQPTLNYLLYSPTDAASVSLETWPLYLFALETVMMLRETQR